MNTPALCFFCGLRPSQVGTNFCCEGCQTLFSLSGLKQLAPASEPSKEDSLLVRDYGKDLGTRIRFECTVDPLVCEACLYSLVRLESSVPGLLGLHWNRQNSILSFDFPKGAELPTVIHDWLQRLRLSPRWKSPRQGQIVNRSRTLRLGLTAALAGNIMLFSFAIYAGISGPLQVFFEWIQFVLFLPVFLWSALPFYQTALVSLRLKQLSVDLPLALAFFAGSFFSTLSLIQGGHDLYYDSLSGFLFLILTSRWMLESSLTHYLQSPSMDQFFENPFLTVTRHEQTQQIPWHTLQKGDLINLGIQDRLPVDAKVVSGSVEIETAWMTGEKQSHLRLRGSLIEAGAKILAPAFVQVEALGGPQESHFARLLSSLQNQSSRLRSTPEARLGSLLVLGCFAAILLLFVFGSFLGLSEILRRSVALLIVACPCAVSFASPLARAKASRLARNIGFWVRDPQAWQTLARVRKIAFDKTGTLTGGFFLPAPDSPLIDRHWKQIILSLENVSKHPIAESLRRCWGALPLLDVENAAEAIGVGVSGKINGVHYELRGSENASESLTLGLWRENQKVMELKMQDEVTLDAERSVRGLKKHHELFLISGDQPSRVQSFGKKMGFDESGLFGGLSPERKLEKIRELKPDLYFGDGTNDLLALQEAPVSVAVGGASLEAQAASDLLMLDADLSHCPDLFQIAKETSRLNRRNLLIALAYNLIAGTLALAGWINPLTAAVLMPIASLVLLLSTLRGTAGLRRFEKSGDFQ